MAIRIVTENIRFNIDGKQCEIYRTDQNELELVHDTRYHYLGSMFDDTLENTANTLTTKIGEALEIDPHYYDDVNRLIYDMLTLFTTNEQ